MFVESRKDRDFSESYFNYFQGDKMEFVLQVEKGGNLNFRHVEIHFEGNVENIGFSIRFQIFDLEIQFWFPDIFSI